MDDPRYSMSIFEFKKVGCKPTACIGFKDETDINNKTHSKHSELRSLLDCLVRMKDNTNELSPLQFDITLYHVGYAGIRKKSCKIIK